MEDDIPPGGTVLPFQSRNVRQHSDEELSTDDVEVVRHVRNAASVAPSNQFGTTLRSSGTPSARRPQADRPQVPAPIPASTRARVAQAQDLASFSEPDEEMTCLMPSKLVLPPAMPSSSKRGNEMRSMSFRPQPQPQSRRAEPIRTHTPQPMRVMAARQESMADSMVHQHHHIPAAPASLAPMAMPSVDSDPRFNPAATVMTSRSLAGRPTVSWAAALVVMGIFAGLVTAAVARGDLDGDAKVAAASGQPTVQQVIPASAQAQLAAAQQPAASPMMGSLYSSGTTSSMAVSAPISAAPMMVQQPVVQQPVAVAAPVAAKFTPAPRAAAPRAAAPVAHVAVAKADPKPEVKEEKKVAAKSKKETKGDDIASAKEAQALADAQLAASL
jgi:hypothetical protein